MGEELAPSIGIVTAKSDGVDPRGNVHLKEPQLAVVHSGVTLGDLGLPFSQRLHLGTDQDDAALQGFEDLEVVAGAAIRGDDPVACPRLSRFWARCS